jgi:hypothetical protein
MVADFSPTSSDCGTVVDVVVLVVLLVVVVAVSVLSFLIGTVVIGAAMKD